MGPRPSTEEEEKETKRGKERNKKKSNKAIYRPTEALRPSPYVLSDDPNHPNMRTYYSHGQEHTANLMPENTFFKDHDSEVLLALLLDQSISFLSDDCVVCCEDVRA